VAHLDALLPLLEPHHELFVVALPGHVEGFQFGDGVEFSIEAVIDALERSLDSAELERPHLVGSSLGGWAAFQLAARGRAKSVVGLAPAGGWETGSKLGKRVIRFFANNYRLLRIGGPRADLIASRPRLRALALRDVVAHPGKLPAASAAQMIRGAYECPVYRTALASARREGLGDLPGPIPEDVPVRIAWGTRDRILRWPAYSERFRTPIPHAEWIELAGLGHLPMWDDPELTARTILDFTQRVDAVTRASAPAAWAFAESMFRRARYRDPRRKDSIPGGDADAN
jgi:pimeloyl-ACP methyl ester carboxylesterase